MKKFNALFAKQSPQKQQQISIFHDDLIKFCKDFKIKTISWNEFGKYLLKSEPIYIFKPDVQDFDEVSKDLHHISSHKLYLEYAKACKVLGIPRNKRIFTMDQIAKVIKVTSRTKKKLSKKIEKM